MIIDVAAHIVPPRFAGQLGSYSARMAGALPALFNLDLRLRAMDRFAEHGYRQILSVVPSVETADRGLAPDIVARMLNEELRAMVDAWPDRFAGAFGALPMTDRDGALREIEHLVDLGLPGFLFHTSVGGVALDDPNIQEILGSAFQHGLVGFMHPVRDGSPGDYPGENRSLFDIWQVFGWPYETTVAMTRLAFSGLLDRFPDAVIITHHLGGVTPYLAGRAADRYDREEVRTIDGSYVERLTALPRHPLEYLRMFYGDTALYGVPRALACGVDFFGADHVLWGSDMPFSAGGGGAVLIDRTILALAEAGLSTAEMDLISADNARRIFRLPAA